MSLKPLILLACISAMAAGTAPVVAASKLDRWDDGQGKTFRGQPVEIMGPFALFRTDSNSGRRVLLHFLSPEDCVRFHDALPAGSGTLTTWAETTGELSREYVSKVYRLSGDTLEKVDTDTAPEPKLLMLLFCSGNSDRLREVVDDCLPLYRRLHAEYPNLFEFIYISVRRSPSDHLGFARLTAMPWLIVDFDSIPAMSKTMRLAPSRDQWLWVVSRDGVPIISTGAARPNDVKTAFAEFESLLALMRPDDPRVWPDRAHYFRAVRAAEHKMDKADPMLIGNPVDVAALGQFGVERMEATINVAADGAVKRVEIARGKNITAEIAQAVGRGLRQAVFVPAVDHGTNVDGVYTLTMVVPPSAIVTPPPPAN